MIISNGDCCYDDYVTYNTADNFREICANITRYQEKLVVKFDERCVSYSVSTISRPDSTNLRLNRLHVATNVRMRKLSVSDRCGLENP